MTQQPPIEPSSIEPSSSDTSSSQPSSQPHPPGSSYEVGIDVHDNSGQAIAHMHHSRATSVESGTYIERVENHYHSGTPKASQAAAPPSALASPPQELDLPPLLPYLADRSDQETALKRFLPRLEGLSRPVVIIVHGDEYQCDLKFLRRLKELTLPSIFANCDDVNPEQIVIREHRLQWPSAFYDDTDLFEQLRMKLSEVVLNNPYKQLEDINRNFSHLPGITMVSTILQTTEWSDRKVNVLNKLLRFWQQWPALVPQQRLVVCISVKYRLLRLESPQKFGCPDEASQLFAKKSLLDWLLDLWKLLQNYHRRRQYKKLNEEIASSIRAIADIRNDQPLSGLIRGFDGLSGIVLNPLESVKHTDAEKWALSKETSEFLGESNVDELTEFIRDLYSARNDEEITMEELAKQLLTCLKAMSSQSREWA